MGNNSGNALARTAPTSELSTDNIARVVESLVLRGDISALSPEDRAKYYVQMCESLGLNPASQPFAMLRLNGKEVMYPTRGATDQLAAIHRVNREIIDGPKLVDIAGTKVAYAVCRATHPNGRVETAIATLPVTDPATLFMKLETKAKRRATISVLGLGMLDESEIESIPAREKAPAEQIVVTHQVRRAVQLVDDDIANYASNDGAATEITLEQATAIVDTHYAALADEGPEAALAHVEVVRTGEEREAHAWALWHTVREIEESRAAVRACGSDARAVTQNAGSCMMYGAPCSYLPVCEGTASIDDPTRYRRLPVAHAELPAEMQVQTHNAQRP